MESGFNRLSNLLHGWLWY